MEKCFGGVNKWRLNDILKDFLNQIGLQKLWRT